MRGSNTVWYTRDACPQLHALGGAEAAGAMRTVSSNRAASGCYPGVFPSFLRHMATMDTLAALGCSRCATGAGAGSHVEAPARLVAPHQHPAKRRTVLALLSHGYLEYSVASDEKLLETSRGLGTGGPAAWRHRSSSARERGRKQGTVLGIVVSGKSLEKLILDVFFVVDHDHDLKNCLLYTSPSPRD